MMADGPKKKSGKKGHQRKAAKQNTEVIMVAPKTPWPLRIWNLITGRHLSPADHSASWTARGTIILAIVGVGTLWVMINGDRADVQSSAAYFVPLNVVPDTRIVIKTEIRNIGKRTADIIDGRITTRFAENGKNMLPEIPEYTEISMYDSNMTGFVAPGQTLVGVFTPMSMSHLLMFSPQQITELQSGQANFWVYGYFMYRDSYSWLTGSTTIGFCYSYQQGMLGVCGFDGRNYIYSH